LGLGDVLFGRKKLKGAKLDRLFALSTAQVTLETELGLRSAGVAGVVFKSLSAGEFLRAEQQIDELLGVVAQTSGSEVRRRQDSLGYQWLVVRDRDFEDLVTGAEEIRLRNELQGELPFEEDLSRWLGLFDAPLD
jgi:hypothetical protein